MQVQLFIPCFIDQFYPQTGINTLRLLEKAGCQVSYNSAQTCCGQPAYNSGYLDEATQLAKKFLSDFDSHIPVVSPSASCTGYVREHYGKLLQNNSAFVNKHNALKENIFELSDFLVNKLNIVDFNATFPHTVTYHDACSALREYGIRNEPRLLLQQVKGLTLVEMNECETCCGFGGTFSVKHPDISAAMAEKKVQSALETGVEYIVSTEASCLMHIDGYISKHKLPIKCIHLADVISCF